MGQHPPLVISCPLFFACASMAAVTVLGIGNCCWQYDFQHCLTIFDKDFSIEPVKTQGSYLESRAS